MMIRMISVFCGGPVSVSVLGSCNNKILPSELSDTSFACRSELNFEPNSNARSANILDNPFWVIVRDHPAPCCRFTVKVHRLPHPPPKLRHQHNTSIFLGKRGVPLWEDSTKLEQSQIKLRNKF